MAIPDRRLLAMAAASRGGVFTTTDALLAGYTIDQIKYRVRSGQWTKLRRGAYADREVTAASGGPEFEAIAAALAVMGEDAAASHLSGAHLLGLDVGRRFAPSVWLTRPPSCRNGRHEHRGIVERAARLPASDVMIVGELRCTAPARTLVDLARHLSFADAVAFADLALRNSLTTAHALEDTLTGQERWPGASRARRVLDFASPLSESPLESFSRALFDNAAIPPPEIQKLLIVGDQFLGRCDFYWESHRLVGEADGRFKYDDPAVLWAEKRREDRLREAGFEIIRWSWGDVFNTPELLVARLRRALSR